LSRREINCCCRGNVVQHVQRLKTEKISVRLKNGDGIVDSLNDQTVAHCKTLVWRLYLKVETVGRPRWSHRLIELRQAWKAKEGSAANTVTRGSRYSGCR
jgi:hypothetical protein